MLKPYFESDDSGRIEVCISMAAFSGDDLMIAFQLRRETFIRRK